MITVTADTHTYVDLIWIEKRLQRWIRFGRIASEQRWLGGPSQPLRQAGRSCFRDPTDRLDYEPLVHLSNVSRKFHRQILEQEHTPAG